MKTLILGGIRSGKSRYAAELARGSGAVTLIATAQPLDAEMAARIETHRACRPAHWQVVEEPVHLAAALERTAGPDRLVIIDCLTLWLSNLLCGEDPQAAVREPKVLLDTLTRVPGSTVLVSNEVGFGIMPANLLARRFADAAGTLHQSIAALCDRVVLMTAGLPLALKSLPLLLWLALGLGMGGAAHASAVTLRDDLQREVTLAEYPKRVVSMLPSLTETVCALGACDRLVATDRFSNWPEQVRSLPKAGGLEDAQIEMIVGARPDLVLLSRSQRISDRLSELKVRSFVLETNSYVDIARTINLVGELLGLSSKAALLNARIAADVRTIGDRARALRPGNGPSVYFEVDRGPYAAGEASFIGEMIDRVGARNIVGAELGPFPKLNPEYVVRRNPDVIFITVPAEAEHLAERPAWERIRAVREHRVCTFSSEMRDALVRPGPRVAEGMSAMAECLARLGP